MQNHEEINENGFIRYTSLWGAFLGELNCFLGNHYWMCDTPIDAFGNYIHRPQTWICRRCAKPRQTKI